MKVKYRLKGLPSTLYDAPRSGRPKKVTMTMESELTALACSPAPKGRVRWTISLLLKHGEEQFHWGVKRTTIWRTLKKRELQPWRKQMWCITDLSQEYIERMYNLLRLYALPCDPDYLVVCLDEKSSQIFSHLRTPITMTLTHPYREDYQYKKKEIMNFFVIVEPKGGQRIVLATRKKTGKEFSQVLQILAETYSHAKQIRLVMDNFSTHRIEVLERYLGPNLGVKLQEKFEWHFTPVHASWLNMAETEIGALEKTCLNKRFASLKEFLEEVQYTVDQRNHDRKQINWSYTVEKATKKFPKLKEMKEQKELFLTLQGESKQGYNPPSNFLVPGNFLNAVPKVTALLDPPVKEEKKRTLSQEWNDSSQKQRKTKKNSQRKTTQKKTGPNPKYKKKFKNNLSKETKKTLRLTKKVNSSVLSSKEKKFVEKTITLIRNPSCLRTGRSKTITLTWSARIVLEFLKTMISHSQSLLTIRKQVGLEARIVSASLARLVALGLIHLDDTKNLDPNIYQPSFSFKESGTDKGPPR
jgi:transposase